MHHQYYSYLPTKREYRVILLVFEGLALGRGEAETDTAATHFIQCLLFSRKMLFTMRLNISRVAYYFFTLSYTLSRSRT